MYNITQVRMVLANRHRAIYTLKGRAMIDKYDGYTPSKRSPQHIAIDGETDAQTLKRMVTTYRYQLLEICVGIAGAVVIAYGCDYLFL